MKYKLIDINEHMRTRDVYLQNKITGKIEKCFDDSYVVRDENFSFMKIGEIYNCKIKLFGKVVNESSEESLECKISNRNIVVGNRELFEVLIDNNIYYVLKSYLSEDFKEDKFYIESSRKDLIQVNDNVHGDYLE